MKKKNFMLLSVFALFALAAFTSYKTLRLTTTSADLMLNENIEALTAGDKPCIYRLFPCAHTSGTECVFSSNTSFPTCCLKTNC